MTAPEPQTDKTAPRPRYKADCTLQKGERKGRDRFGFKVLAPGIADLLDEMDTPNCVGILGPWGSGKSSLVEWVQDELVEKHGGKVKTSIFPTWMYDQGEGADVVYALVSAVEKSLFGDQRGKKLVDSAIRRSLRVSLVAAMTFANSAARLKSAGLLDPLGDIGAAQTLAAKVVRKKDDWVDATTGLQDKFSKVIQRGLAHCGAERLVVFLDDLDRCLPHNVVTLLERLKNFLMVKDVIFVIVADRAAIVEAICKTYNYEPSFGDRYLDKITTINFEVAAKPDDDLFLDLLQDATDAFRVPEQLGPADLRLLYSRFRPVGLDNPRIARKVAAKFVILNKGPMSRVVGVDLKMPNPKFVEAFMHRQLGPDVDKGKVALKVFWCAAFAVVALRNVFPIAFAVYDDALLDALRKIARPNHDSERPVADDITYALIRRAGIPDSSRGQLADALFDGPKESRWLRLGEIRFVYDSLGPWL